ncbi:DegT/DnrJ/EryC1/StrS family aminotransferase [Virgibacillus kekensis]|uniref:DegT/DnrJ/EryC1/StrS family aminotransferase n=1 Tax=Virgibacillus kekensis TaxID=202261 RepID=A0ABV9DGP1_9BACI
MKYFVHESSYIDDNVKIGEGTKVWHFSREKLQSIVETTFIPETYYSSFAQYTIKLRSKEQRDDLQAKLKENDIPSMIYYTKPMHRQQAFTDLPFEEAELAVTNNLCDTVLSLPMHPYLKEEEITKVCDVIQEFRNA